MTKKRLVLSLICAVAAVFFAVKCIAFADAQKNNIEFLKSYGWEVNAMPIERVEINIPDPFDRVYDNYNLLQLDADLDLSPYKGKECVRYTYLVTNYPEDVGEEVRANVICCDGTPIGGDIMTVILRHG